MEEEQEGTEQRMESRRVCVTGASGFIGATLVKQLLENGFTVHATLRNLEDKSKVAPLKSLPNADTKLVLFQADIYNPDEFSPAITGCECVFHLATPLQHDPQSFKFKDTCEAAVAGMKSIADSCIRSQTVKRLIYTASMVSSSPLKEDGSGFKSSYLDESSWTPLGISCTNSTEALLAYTRSKTLAEKEALTYNEIENGKLEVVSLVCGLTGGETLISHLTGSVQVLLSPFTGDLDFYNSFKFLEELCGSILLVHVEDVCRAHIFCMEQPSMKGRFLCAALNPTIKDIAIYFKEKYPESRLPQELIQERKETITFDGSKLMLLGFEYKYGLRSTIDDSVASARRLGISPST